jgi:hypothetical protein
MPYSFGHTQNSQTATIDQDSNKSWDEFISAFIACCGKKEIRRISYSSLSDSVFLPSLLDFRFFKNSSDLPPKTFWNDEAWLSVVPERMR